jgi:hypothetical protein
MVFFQKAMSSRATHFSYGVGQSCLRKGGAVVRSIVTNLCWCQRRSASIFARIDNVNVCVGSCKYFLMPLAEMVWAGAAGCTAL